MALASASIEAVMWPMISRALGRLQESNLDLGIAVAVPHLGRDDPFLGILGDVRPGSRTRLVIGSLGLDGGRICGIGCHGLQAHWLYCRGTSAQGSACATPLGCDVPQVFHDGLGPPGPPDRPEDGSALGAVLAGLGSEVQDLLDRDECGVIIGCSDLGEAYELCHVLRIIVPVQDRCPGS